MRFYFFLFFIIISIQFPQSLCYEAALKAVILLCMPPHKTASKTCFTVLMAVQKTPVRLMFDFVCLRFSLYVSSRSLLTISQWILRGMFQRKVTLWVSLTHITSFTSEQRANSINSEVP